MRRQRHAEVASVWMSAHRILKHTAWRFVRAVYIGKHLSHFAGVFDPDINSAGEMASCRIACKSWTFVTRRCLQPSLQYCCCRCCSCMMPSNATRTPILFSDTLKYHDLVTIIDLMAFTVRLNDSRHAHKRRPATRTMVIFCPENHLQLS